MSPVAKEKFNDATLWIVRITVGCFATLFSIVTVIIGVIASEMRADLKIIINERSGNIERLRRIEDKVADHTLDIKDLYNKQAIHQQEHYK